MELILGWIGTITGVLGLISSVVMGVILARRQEHWQDKKDRMAFLSNVIFDTSIPRESRQAFYDEYIGKGGNGPVVRFWLSEGEKEKKALEK